MRQVAISQSKYPAANLPLPPLNITFHYSLCSNEEGLHLAFWSLWPSCSIVDYNLYQDQEKMSKAL